MNIYEKLLEIQNELKAPKSQYNSFGKYNYRNAEDILEVAKPLCKKYKAVLTLKDDVLLVGNRYYIQAIASLIDIEKPTNVIEVTGLAREEETKKGMDGSQVTGASSSYARKCALNGLFDIDDTKDSDYTNTGSQMLLKDTKQEKSIDNSITLENAHKIKVKNKAGQEIKLDSLSISQLELVVAKGGDLGKLADLLLEEKYNDTTAEDMNEAMKSLNKQTEMKC